MCHVTGHHGMLVCNACGPQQFSHMSLQRAVTLPNVFPPGPFLACLLYCGAFCRCRLSADEALERVQRAFDTRKDNERRSPETDEQHKMVKDFVASLKA